MYDPSKPHNRIIANQVARTKSSRWATLNSEGYIHKKFVLPVLEVDHTDGIGTKGILHWQCRTFRNAVLDALAMNLNDLQMFRATPYKLQNHIFLPKEDLSAVSDIATALADECVSREILISGGECAIHDDMRGMEISITMSGFVDQTWPNKFEAGDVLVGLASNGIHSNGFSLIRHLSQEHGTDKLPFRDVWLTPTRIYNLPVVPFEIKGIQHITGGAFTKLKKHLGGGLDAHIYRNHEIDPQDEFHQIYRCVYSNETMYRNFNCGIGMVLSVDPKAVDRVISKIGGEPIGEVREGTGTVIIESKFNKSVIAL